MATHVQGLFASKLWFLSDSTMPLWYDSDPDIEVTVENGDIELTDEQESEIELEVAMHPFILYRKKD